MPFESIPESRREEQQQRFTEAYAVLHQAVAAEAFPGCAFGVLVHGKVLLLDALGHFTYPADDSTPRAVTPQTLYDVASLTKVVSTTSAAMLLYQRGLLDLETPVGELLPGFVIGRDPSEHARKVTLAHLLAHSSGLPGYVPLFHTATTPYAVLRGCLELPIQAEPGTRAEYSDPGFILLGKALEAILGEELAPWTRREVFAPPPATVPRLIFAPKFRPRRTMSYSVSAVSRARSRMSTPFCSRAQAVTRDSSAVFRTCCASPSQYWSQRSIRSSSPRPLSSSPSASRRRAVPGLWGGTRLPRNPLPATSFHPIRSAISATPAARSGSTVTQSWR